MKIEFKKVPQTPKTFSAEYDSVKIEGTFCKISQSLVKIDSIIRGETSIQCSRCGEDDTITLEDEFNFLISDGIFKNDSSESEDLIIEVDNHIIDFDKIIQSEISSIRSDYYICKNCINVDFVEKEY